MASQRQELSPSADNLDIDLPPLSDIDMEREIQGGMLDVIETGLLETIDDD